MAQLGTGETGSRSGPEMFCLFVTPIVGVGLSSFLCLLLLFFEKGFKILATEYSEFLDSDNSDGGDNPTEADYDYI